MSLCLFFLLAFAEPWSVRGKKPHIPAQIEVGKWFTPAPSGWANGTLHSDPKALAATINHTLRYLHKNPQSRGVHAGMFQRLGIRLEAVEQSLAFLAFHAQNNPHLLHQPQWWERHFQLYRWNADAVARPDSKNGQIRLTKYVVYEFAGSKKKTTAFPHALWAIPKDERWLSEAQAETRQDLLRKRLSRQDVLAGALEKQYAGQAKPLVWLSRQGLFEAMMQGTIAVRYANGKKRYFNVHRSNERPYIKGLAMAQQERYWFFRPTKGVYGWGQGKNKIRLAPYVAVAGDVDNLGLGKLFWLRTGTANHLAVLADTGGAFQPNLRQLDWFIGSVPDRHSLNAVLKKLPSFVDAGILLLRSQLPPESPQTLP